MALLGVVRISQASAVVGSLIALAACGRGSDGGADTPEPSDTSPYQATSDVQALEPMEMSPLGFSPAEATEVFAGEYTRVVSYSDGTGASQLSIAVQPNARNIEFRGTNTLEEAPYVYAEGGSLAGRAARQARGVKGGPAVVMSVDIRFVTDDGRFDESIETVLKAHSLEFARIDTGRVLPGAVLGEEEHEMDGTFRFDPDAFTSPSLGIYIDLYRNGAKRSTTGWVSGDVERPDGRPDVHEFASWGLCPLPDAGVGYCADAGLN